MKKIILLAAAFVSFACAQVITINKAGHWAVVPGIKAWNNVFFQPIPNAALGDSLYVYGSAVINGSTNRIYLYANKTLRDAGDTTTAIAGARGFTSTGYPRVLTLTPRNASGCSLTVQIPGTIGNGTSTWDLAFMNINSVGVNEAINTAVTGLIALPSGWSVLDVAGDIGWAYLVDTKIRFSRTGGVFALDTLGAPYGRLDSVDVANWIRAQSATLNGDGLNLDNGYNPGLWNLKSVGPQATVQLSMPNGEGGGVYTWDSTGIFYASRRIETPLVKPDSIDLSGAGGINVAQNGLWFDGYSGRWKIAHSGSDDTQLQITHFSDGTDPAYFTTDAGGVSLRLTRDLTVDRNIEARYGWGAIDSIDTRIQTINAGNDEAAVIYYNADEGSSNTLKWAAGVLGNAAFSFLSKASGSYVQKLNIWKDSVATEVMLTPHGGVYSDSTVQARRLVALDSIYALNNGFVGLHAYSESWGIFPGTSYDNNLYYQRYDYGAGGNWGDMSPIGDPAYFQASDDDSGVKLVIKQVDTDLKELRWTTADSPLSPGSGTMTVPDGYGIEWIRCYPNGAPRYCPAAYEF